MLWTLGNEYGKEDSSHSESGSEYDDSDGGGVSSTWTGSRGLHLEKDNLKNVIKRVGQMFSLAESFRYTMWKYAIANKFDYYFVRNCRQRIAMRCTLKGVISTYVLGAS